MIPSQIATRSKAITPSDTTAQFPDSPGANGISLSMPHARYLYIGTGGTLTYVTSGGDLVTATVAAGHFYCEITWIKATGTTATNIVAFY